MILYLWVWIFLIIHQIHLFVVMLQEYLALRYSHICLKCRIFMQ